MKQQLAAGLSEGQVAEFVENELQGLRPDNPLAQAPYLHAPYSGIGISTLETQLVQNTEIVHSRLVAAAKHAHQSANRGSLISARTEGASSYTIPSVRPDGRENSHVSAEPDCLPHRGDRRDALPTRRARPHRWHLRLCRAPAAALVTAHVKSRHLLLLIERGVAV